MRSPLLQVKELFKKYDVDKNAALSLDEMKKMMHDLRDDVCIIGKVPNLSEEEVDARRGLTDRRSRCCSTTGTRTRTARSRGQSFFEA